MSDEELEIDMSLPPSQLLSYLNADSDEKLFSFCSMTLHTALLNQPYSYLEDVFLPGIQTLLYSESLEIAIATIEAMPDIAELISAQYPNKKEEIFNGYLFPTFISIIDEADERMTQCLSKSYSSLIFVMGQDEFLETQLPILKNMAQSDERETKYVLSSILLEMYNVFEPEIWLEDFIEIVEIFMSDNSGSVRALVPPLISTYMKKITSIEDRIKLSGIFSLFSKDRVEFVRQSVADSIVSILEPIDINIKKLMFRPIITNLLEDTATDVRTTTLQNIGRILACFGPSADQKLVESYTTSLYSREPIISYNSAFTFPAVALSLGKDRWKELRDGFFYICNSSEIKNRRTLAFGLNSICHLLDPSDLEQVSISFLRDTQCVSIGVISSLHQIIGYIEHKEHLVFCLTEPAEKYSDWRTRIKVSEQLRYCIDDFPRKVLLESAKELVEDEVSVVRRDATTSLSHLLQAEDMPFIETLSTKESYSKRICAASLFNFIDSDLAVANINVLLKLAKDRVTNVRIASAHSLSALIKRASEKVKTKISEVLIDLQKDVDADVRNAANGAEM